jgi:hypothetical protein
MSSSELLCRWFPTSTGKKESRRCLKPNYGGKWDRYMFLQLQRVYPRQCSSRITPTLQAKGEATTEAALPSNPTSASGRTRNHPGLPGSAIQRRPPPRCTLPVSEFETEFQPTLVTSLRSVHRKKNVIDLKPCPAYGIPSARRANFLQVVLTTMM